MAITKIKTETHEEWLELRSKYIGGSDAAAVVGMNAFQSPYSLWAEKTGRIPGFSGNLATEVGAYLEEFVAQKFAQETGKRVRKVNQSLINDAYPWAIANIDREIVGEDAGLEIKTTSELNMRKFKGGEYPEKYYAQCVHYMAVTGKSRWYLAVLIGNRDFRIFTIERDDAEIAALMAAEREFWEHVKNDAAPPADGLQATTEALNDIYPDGDGQSVYLFGYDTDLAEYQRLGKVIKDLQAAHDEAANRIKAFMGKAGTGEADRYRVSWKTSARRTFDSKRFEEENPNIDLSEYYRESSARIFRVNEIKSDKE